MLYVNEIDQIVEQAAEQQEDWFFDLDVEENEEINLDLMFD